jgi:hypothetical protein
MVWNAIIATRPDVISSAAGSQSTHRGIGGPIPRNRRMIATKTRHVKDDEAIWEDHARFGGLFMMRAELP